MKPVLITSFLAAITLLMPGHANAIDFDDDESCPVFVGVASMEPTDGEAVPAALERQIHARLSRAISQSGMVDNDLYPRFFVAAQLDNDFYDVLSNGQHVLKADLTLYLGDNQSKTVFATEIIPVKGVGASKERAAIKAVSSLNTRSRALEEFMNRGRKKIIDYFNQAYPGILAAARQAISQRDYGQAYYLAGMIPACCQGYNQSQQVMEEAWKGQSVLEGQKALMQAQAEWATHPDAQGAEKAFALLVTIDPSSPSFAEAQKLAKTIGSRVETQYDFENIQKYNDSVQTERHRIDAIREATVAYASHQPQTQTEINWIK